MTWTRRSEAFRVGDTFTVAGVYKRRTFWGWLRRGPKELRRFRMSASVTADAASQEQNR